MMYILTKCINKLKGVIFMADQYNQAREQGFSIGHFIVRLIVGAVVLAVTAALTPGFSISSLWALILGAVVLAVLDYVVSRLLGRDASPFGRGISGFILAALVIYATQFFVAGYVVSVWGAILGAVIYGIVDLLIPGRAM
jgi:putative membrane protein